MVKAEFRLFEGLLRGVKLYYVGRGQSHTIATPNPFCCIYVHDFSLDNP